MNSDANNSTLEQLCNDFDVIVERILERLQLEYQPKNRARSNFLYQTHIKHRYVLFEGIRLTCLIDLASASV